MLREPILRDFTLMTDIDNMQILPDGYGKGD
jgi:hypothetical protein